MKKTRIEQVIAILIVASMMFSLFSLQVSATSNASNVESNGYINNSTIPSVNEIEAWYGQQPVPNLSSSYVKYLQDVKNGNNEIYNGIIPSMRPVIESEFSDNNQRARAVLPTKYDPRENNMVTSVKNQGQRGICWIYGAVSSIESYLILERNMDRNYSENYYNYYFASDAYSDISENLTAYDIPIDDEVRPRRLNEGGYVEEVFKAMLQGIGPVRQDQFDDDITDRIPSSMMNISPDALLLGYEVISSLNPDADNTSLNAKIQN